jgi:DNA polymerase I-like protein with 3'-5' exonuclease and polymerase domains
MSSFGKYNILTTEEEIRACDAHLKALGHDLYAVDTETNGLKFWRDVVIGISFSYDSKSGFYIPFLTWVPDASSKKIKKIKGVITEVYEKGWFECVWTGEKYPETVSNKEYVYPRFIVDFIRSWFGQPQKRLIMHNAPFDILFIEFSLGINLTENLFCDTVLLKHIIDENSSNGLKETAILWSKRLGIPVQEQANQEQIEVGRSIVRNGGDFGKKRKTIWRADLPFNGKYAVADTFLTYGVFEVGIKQLSEEYEDRHFDWFFKDEVMPLCREVVIPMRRNGVRIDVPYFQEMEQECRARIKELEDTIILQISEWIRDFDIGVSVEQIATKKAIIEQIIKEEGLNYPTKTNKKGEVKKTLTKATVKKEFADTGHWLWGYLLGENELRYSPDQLEGLKKRIYEAKTGRRYQFRISSDAHLRWLFCKKLGYDPKSLPQTDAATKTKIIPSMKAVVLKEFFLKEHTFVKPLLLYKKLQKLYSTYILPALELNNNGYLHMDMVQSGTVSGRFACRGGFNLQTLPRVEEIDRCLKCKSKDIVVIHPIKLIAVMACNACGHIEEDIICPSAIKKGFIAPEGYKIVNADYASLEPRVFSFMSGDPKLKEIYLKDLDLYSKIYCDMEDPEGKYSPDPKAPNFLKKVDNAKRNMVKPVVLGIPYGALGPQTARLMNFKIVDPRTGKERLDVDRGKAFREKYLSTYPDLRKYMDGQDAKACGDGYVETLVGRRRHFKFTKPVFKILSKAGLSLEEFLEAPRKALDTQHIDDKYFSFQALKKLSDECGFHLKDQKGIPRTWAFVRSMFKNELNNSKNCPIQGLGAHIANRGMLETSREYKRRGLASIIVLQVHDEITSYAKLDEVDVTVQIKKRCMENNMYAKLVDIPMVAEPIVADNLKEAK